MNAHAIAIPVISRDRADPGIVTSAWMAAGMTSRARRPLPPNPAG